MSTELVVDKLSIDRIRRYLETEIVGQHLHLFDDVGSTNRVLRRLALEGAAEGTAVLAETQNAGRGRWGTPWFSPPGLNLYISVLLRPAISLTAVPVFSFLASLALMEAVRSTGLAAWIKWPNDIMVDDRKVAGCLADVHGRASQVDHVILGTGINLNVLSAELRDALGDVRAGSAASLAELTGRHVDRNLFAATLLNQVERWLNVYRVDGPTAVLEAWRERDALAGQEITVCGEGLRLSGRACGVDDAGYLIVATSDGRRRVTSGQIVAAAGAAGG